MLFDGRFGKEGSFGSMLSGSPAEFDSSSMERVFVVQSTEQKFGADPLMVRESDHYQEEYTEGFVGKWDELIDWDSRAESEGDFFISELKKHGAKKVLDVATGTGFHSVRLL